MQLKSSETWDVERLGNAEHSKKSPKLPTKYLLVFAFEHPLNWLMESLKDANC